MDIFDILSKKIGYRNLSKREKILLIILTLLLIEFLFYNLLIRKEREELSEKELNSSIYRENLDYKYNGFGDFSSESVSKILREKNLTEDNFSKESHTDVEVLSISGQIDAANFDNIKDFTKYYGFSNIDLNRSDEDNFTYVFKAKKPSKTIYYSDLKSAYFGEDSQKENNDVLESSLENKEIEKLKNDNEIVKFKNSNKKDESIKGSEGNKKYSIKDNNIKSKNIDKIEKNIVSENKIKEEVFTLGNDFLDKSIEDSVENKLENDKFIVSDEDILLNYYENSEILSVYVKKDCVKDLIKLGVNRHCNGMSMYLFFPYDSCKEFGVINILGEKIPYNGQIINSDWFKVNIFEEDISYFYLIPKEGEDLFFFAKEVEYYEEV
ncbi:MULTISPECIES: hypothetical protein [Peptoniphilus]|jgi:putative uncharacterized protein (fragment)|uniref:hypothetical protein n=1 Tax=Peptoniphilus TaxID=162289 RepID=UPI00290198D5|nr:MULTISPECIES: hypothetical protein [Peptoniphilus]MBS6610620.1 hypothetical protein [Peptoniphilus harei]MDU1044013.1 hypothetical protein [Peptoniphilus rhinitidis]MDU1954632.1 hypothetical protein [Peptoniphilus lacydonensis]MDU5377822.1 hypothetical protein [Peptoniphilus lacydonensis]MDU5436923.1 hypothetical protein [Peptoniphilus lacydonensis]